MFSNIPPSKARQAESQSDRHFAFRLSRG